MTFCPSLGVSVVVPTFNRRDSLLRAIESVKCSTPDHVEIVVIDDASSIAPETFLPASNTHGVSVRCYSFRRNRGPQAARNLGIRRARFAYVAFLDSDDAFHASKLDRILQEVKEGRPPDLLFHAVTGMAKYNALARWWARYLPSNIPLRWLLTLYNPIVTSALVVRRCRRMGLPRLRHCEDYFFLFHYCRPDTITRYLDEELSSVFRAAGSPGGLSANVWRMRKGEFTARRALLKERTASGLMRYAAGTTVGLLRVASDLIRGRYWL